MSKEDKRDRDTPQSGALALPAHVAGSGSLDRLVETACGYARASAAEATLRAYATDWAEFGRWCRRKGIDPLIPAPEVVGLYLTDLASGAGGPARSVATLERRLAGLVWPGSTHRVCVCCLPTGSSSVRNGSLFSRRRASPSASG